VTFAGSAVALCGHCAVLLGWRPNEFWNATPAELACVIKALTAQAEMPPETDDISKLMEMFPDG
jgi:hypothetical protein